MWYMQGLTYIRHWARFHLYQAGRRWHAGRTPTRISTSVDKRVFTCFYIFNWISLTNKQTELVSRPLARPGHTADQCQNVAARTWDAFGTQAETQYQQPDTHSTRVLVRRQTRAGRHTVYQSRPEREFSHSNDSASLDLRERRWQLVVPLWRTAC